MFFTLRTNMEWTNEHDIQLLIEMRASQFFTFKKGSPKRGRIWDEITETLNSVKALKFCVKDKEECETDGICCKVDLEGREERRKELVALK